MKKQTALALAAVFSLSVAGTALAAPANPFVDVPAKHWAYDSVNKLAQAGVISGYGDGTFKGDKTLTRYEIAVIVGKAMANSDKMDAETKKALEALKAEFSAELNNLGVRMDNAEKKLDNVKFNGEIRLRYDNTEVKAFGEKEKANPLTLRTRFAFTGQINDEWTYTGRLSNVKNLRDGNNDSLVYDEDEDEYGTGSGDVAFDYANIAGPVAGGKLTVGRIDIAPAYGMIFDDTINGAVYSFGNKLKTDLVYGKQASDLLDSTKYTIGAVNLGYTVGDVNLKGVYYHAKSNVDGADKLKAYEVGFDVPVAKDLKLSAAYTDTNVAEQDRGYMAQLNYKGAQVDKVGSYGVWAAYRNMEAASYLIYTYDFATIVADDARLGGKGYEVGFNYVPFKNGKWTTSYTDVKDTFDGDFKGKYFLTRMEVYF